MNQEWARITEVFDRALALSPEARESLLQREPVGIRTEVEALLRGLERERGRFAGCAIDLLHDSDLRTMLEEAAVGTRVGPYEIVREIGRGGMGVVYEATRVDDDFRKRVAIKLVGLGARTPAVMQRFRRERQILAKLEHPHIAALLDGGLTEHGVPYFALEYVEGEPIDQYVVSRNLTITERITLMRQVCDALQYAHQRLVVHRDLKPGNILVGADGAAKLLDFGVAKLFGDADDSGAGDQTEVGAQAYTPAYASPEQLLGEPLTTACDIHALGIVLYLVVTGRHPYREDGTSAAEVRRRIRESPPPPTGLGADVDAIIALALAKDPRARYASAEQLSEDLRRFVVGLPLLARPGTRWDQAVKFVRRHRVPVAATVLAAVAIVGGSGATWWQARQATRQRERAEAFSDFVRDMLSAPDPSQRGRDARVMDILGAAVARLRVEKAADPQAHAAIQRTLGTTYMRLGVLDTAATLLDAALATTTSDLGPRHLETARSQRAVADLRAIAGNTVEAERLYLRAIATFRAAGNAGASDLAPTLSEYGNMLYNGGRLSDAVAPLNESLRMLRAETGADREQVVNVLNSLGMVREHAGDPASAKRHYREALTIRAQLHGPLATSLIGPASNLANVLKLEDSLAAAESLQVSAVADARAAFGERHTVVGATLTGLGDIHRRRGELDAAEHDLREAIAILSGALPADHLQLAPPLSLLGLMLCERGRVAEGEPLLRRALDIRRARLPAGHWFIHNLESALSVCLFARGAHAEAEASARAGLVGLTASLGADHPRTREAARRLSDVQATRRR